MDTPGMRELQLTDVQSGLEDVFAEIGAFANSCHFADCTHEEEPGCGIAAAVASGDVDPDRVSRWRKLVREEAHNRGVLPNVVRVINRLGSITRALSRRINVERAVVLVISD
ncbi:MAG: hypothetical protein HOM16_10830 [Woeseia sp.]|nr:hypothetical protein [Woeseia sp.]